jgi:hypothetical protein
MSYDILSLSFFFMSEIIVIYKSERQDGSYYHYQLGGRSLFTPLVQESWIIDDRLLQCWQPQVLEFQSLGVGLTDSELYSSQT